MSQPLATDIPTAASLNLKSNTSTGSELKRDDWMMEPMAVDTPPPSKNRPQILEDESLTEDYGEASTSSRTLGGGVDFFSDLGTEVKRKNNKPDKPNPEKVHFIIQST
jgi:hypothetical protein